MSSQFRKEEFSNFPGSKAWIHPFDRIALFPVRFISMVMSLNDVSPPTGTHVVILVWFSSGDMDTCAGSRNSCFYIPVESFHLSGNKRTKTPTKNGC